MCHAVSAISVATPHGVSRATPGLASRQVTRVCIDLNHCRVGLPVDIALVQGKSQLLRGDRVIGGRIMKRELRIRLNFVAGSAFVGLLVGGCAMMQPKVEGYVAPPVGSSWTQSNRNTGSYGPSGTSQIARAERTWEGKPVIAFIGARGAFLMDPEGGDVAFVGQDDKPLLRWEPHQNWDWPLQVGKTFTRDYRLIVGADRTIPYTRTCAVKSVEDVSVPAGTFKAWKVECSNTLGVEDSLWFSPELGIFVKSSSKRSAANPFGAGTQEMELVSQTVKK